MGGGIKELNKCFIVPCLDSRMGCLSARANRSFSDCCHALNSSQDFDSADMQLRY